MFGTVASSPEGISISTRVVNNHGFHRGQRPRQSGSSMPGLVALFDGTRLMRFSQVVSHAEDLDQAFSKPLKEERHWNA